MAQTNTPANTNTGALPAQPLGKMVSPRKADLKRGLAALKEEATTALQKLPWE